MLFAWSGIDMVHRFPEIPLGEIGKDGFLRDDHAKHGMGFLNASFLSRTHRITIVDRAALDPAGPGLEGGRVTEFRSAVSKDHGEDLKESIGPECLLKSVKDGPHGTFRTAVQKIGEKESGIRQTEGEDTFQGAVRREDGVHLTELADGKTKGTEIRIKTSAEDFPVSDRLLLPEVLLPWLELHLAL